MNLSSRQIQAFIALTESLSFTRAAAQCHLSQPAFSALIRSLEEGLGLRLFDRSTRHVSLTSEGEDFLVAAKRIRAEMDAALSSMRSTASLERGRVSIALLPSLAAGWLPDVLKPYRDQHPGVEINIADVLSEPCIERVASGKADFALAAVRVDTPELRAEPFCSDDFYLVCRLDHPLAQTPLPGTSPTRGTRGTGSRSARTSAQLRTLAAWPFIHMARHSSVRQYLEAAFHPQNMHTVMEVEQLSTVAGMVLAGLGISVVPALTLFHFEHPQLTTRPLHLPGLTRQIFLVRRRDRGLSVAAQSLYEHVTRHRPQRG